MGTVNETVTEKVTKEVETYKPGNWYLLWFNGGEDKKQVTFDVTRDVQKVVTETVKAYDGEALQKQIDEADAEIKRVMGSLQHQGKSEAQLKAEDEAWAAE